MKIYDMHTHANGGRPDPEGMLAAMKQAGIYGGCVFSAPPHEFEPVKNTYLSIGESFEERLDEVLAWSRGYEGRIFPVLWIHPDEENIIEKIHIAADAGISAFKMICSNYYVYEEKSLRVLREIAKLGKPVIFHTGILWDSKVSSNYNRPLNWEALLDIEGLRFSIGHCSWPWIDECIAMYGKFLNALSAGKSAEMFFDITPGTPENYREELLTKLYTTGYNVGDNIIFGLDSRASDYNASWATGWLRTDGAILDKLGVSLENREKLYYGNLMRFLGVTDAKTEKAAPVPDNSNKWYPYNPEVKNIISKWYSRLSFSEVHDAEFTRALKTAVISDAITVEGYDAACRDGVRNLLSVLFLCEGVCAEYKKRGIPEKILLDTLSDIPIWTDTWSVVKGELFLGELPWLKRHLGMKLFRLGRLQFCMAESERDIPKYSVKRGDPVVEVHIPEGEKLTPEACRESFSMARKFFAKYYPEYEYTVFTCHSWLLDDKLKKYLGEDSNIIRFGDSFDKVEKDKSTALIRYIFPWDTNILNLRYRPAYSTFSQKIKDAVLGGESFYEVLGVIKK